MLTATAALRLSFQPTHILTPLLMVVVAIYPNQSETLRVAFALLLSNLIFLTGKDVWIVIIYRRSDIVLNQPFNDG